VEINCRLHTRLHRWWNDGCFSWWGACAASFL
jgi:hypothetical protein